MSERKIIESERIVNLSDYEELIKDARDDIMWLKKHMEEKNYEVASHLIGQIDLALHKMEAYEFQIERRTLIANSRSEHQ